MTDGKNSKQVKPFREVEAQSMTALVLKEEIENHGYVLIRGLLSPSDLAPLLAEITGVLHNAGWLVDSSPDRIAIAASTCSEDDPQFKEIYDRVFNLPAFHGLPHLPQLTRMMKMLTGPKLLVHPKSAARLIFPHCEPGIIHAHQDHTAVGGDTESFTAWMPLHDCPVEQGSLRILDGSHRFGLQAVAGQTGYIPDGTAQGRGWVGGELSAGDVLLFHSLTVHEAAPNLSDHVRISLDCRFQSYQRVVNPGALVFAGSGRRSWQKVYHGWPANDLQYYWTRFPLQLKPSIEELTELATTCDPPRMRERYARILGAIKDQELLSAATT